MDEQHEERPSPTVWTWTALDDGSIQMEVKPASTLIKADEVNSTRPVVMRGLTPVASLDQFFATITVWPAGKWKYHA